MRKVQANKSKKVAFLFHEDGPSSAAVLGGKGAGLTELARLGVPVPPGFTVTTSVARAFAQHKSTPRRLQWQLKWGISALEQETGKRFGDSLNPLLVSVRSGAPVSMPGMMDTVLNLGLNPAIVKGLARLSGRRFAWDSYRRFLSMFGEVVLGVERHHFEHILTEVIERHQVVSEQMLGVSALQEVCNRLRLMIEEQTGASFPDHPWQQLELALQAVLASWNNQRAQQYRSLHGIGNHLGTAVNIQSMVFGNLGVDSGTGVVFSRNVATGAKGLWGEFLIDAQGEDVVAGTGMRTPMPIQGMQSWNAELYMQLESIVQKLEQLRGYPVDVEFTVEAGKLFILQVRNAKMTPEAAATIATNLVWEKKLTKEEALKRVTSEQRKAILARGFDKDDWNAHAQQVLGSGLPASPGAAVGRVVTTSAQAVASAKAGQKVILVRPDTSPDDLPGMMVAEAIVTMSGGATSHAAVVARDLGKPAVVGCPRFDVMPGEVISVDGASGVVVRGSVKLIAVPKKKEVNIFLRWMADEESKKRPKPRLDFSLIEQSVSVNKLLADFYLTDAISTASQGTAIALEAMRLRSKVHQEVAERLAMYLVVAVGGEIRHARRTWDLPDLKELCLRFNLQLDGEERAEAQMKSIAPLRTADLKEQIKFLELTTSVFEKGHWIGSVGGKPWAAISRAAHQFLTGKLTHSVFADHAFDLEHNNGSVFGKHRMLSGSRDAVKVQLTAKKEAENITALWNGLHNNKVWNGREFCSPAVSALYDLYQRQART